MFGTKRRLAKRIARATLETCYEVMEKNPGLEGLELYSKVLYLVFGHDIEHINKIFEGAAESSFEWADDTGEELKLRDVLYYLLITEKVNVWRRPQLLNEIADIVQDTIPANT